MELVFDTSVHSPEKIKWSTGEMFEEKSTRRTKAKKAKANQKKQTNYVPELQNSTQEIPEMIGDVNRRSILQKKKKEEHENKTKR